MIGVTLFNLNNMNPTEIKRFFTSAIFEYSIAFLFLIYLLTYNLLGLPPVEDLFKLMEVAFQQYGLALLFFGLIIEGLFMVGFYFPGSVVAFGAVIFLGKTYVDILLIILIGSIALILVNILNYMLGKHGYYKLLEKFGAKGTIERMKIRFDKNKNGTILLFSSSPNFLAIISIYAGIVKTNLKEYLRFISLCILFWVSLVSAIIFIFFHNINFKDSKFGWISFFIILAWAIWESIFSFRKEK